MKALLLVFCLALTLAGCSVGALRVFQAKVPAPLVKQAKQLEAERQAADLIARKIETPVELKPVAQALSTSLGAPEKPLKADTHEELIKASFEATAALSKQILAMQDQIKRMNVSLVKLQGKEIEGTGFSLAGPGITTIVLALIVLGCVFPPVFTILGFMYRRLKATSKTIVQGLEDAANDPKLHEAVSEVKSKIGDRMKAHPQKTETLENVVLDLKKA